MIITAWDALTLVGVAVALVGLYLISWPLVLVFVGIAGIYVGVRKA